MKESNTQPSQPLPDFDDLCSLLVPLGALNSPSELHGMLCGRLSGGARLDQEVRLGLVAEFMDLAADIPSDSASVLAELYNTSLAQLNDDNFGLQLLLPDDETELPLRADALGQWCHGFLSGFGSSGIKGEANLGTDTADALRDLAAITQINVEDGEDAEESEASFEQIAEYVRVAVLNIFLECGQPADKKPPQSDNTLH